MSVRASLVAALALGAGLAMAPAPAAIAAPASALVLGPASAPAADPVSPEVTTVPVRAAQPCPPELGPIKLSIAETTRLTGLAACHTKGLITRARLAFALRWSLRRRRHQATARWHHYSARLIAGTGPG